jgi:hypothetical protein
MSRARSVLKMRGGMRSQIGDRRRRLVQEKGNREGLQRSEGGRRAHRGGDARGKNPVERAAFVVKGEGSLGKARLQKEKGTKGSSWVRTKVDRVRACVWMCVVEEACEESPKKRVGKVTPLGRVPGQRD